MELHRQLKRLNNLKIFNSEHLKANIESISAIGTFKSIVKLGGSQTYLHRIVFADNKDKSIYIIDESDGKVLKHLNHKKWLTYGLCCTDDNKDNFIYFTDFNHNLIRKFDENLNEVATFTTPKESPMRGPCGIAINNEFKRIDVVDQKNHRVVSFDLKTNEYLSEFKLYKEALVDKVKRPLIETTLLSINSKSENTDNKPKSSYDSAKLIDYWPFGVYSKNERVFVTDWSKNSIYVYKNTILENRISGEKLFTRIRDIIVDSVGSILVTDIDKRSVFLFDNKGLFLSETKLPIEPKLVDGVEDSVFGLCKIETSKLIFATRSSITVCQLNLS